MEAAEIAKLCAMLSTSDVDGPIRHGLRDCPNDEARIEALEGATTKYGSWLRAASIEQSRNKASRHETKGPGTIPSSSNQENQSGKSSGTGRSSENNSNDHDGSLRLMIALMPVLNKETRNLKGEAVGLLVDSESKLRSPVSGQSDGTKQQTNV
ncbi:hypothetical protein Q3G72_025609 [Acer saccharum]|nr:hypothetical protein Q3G72_025609 [Acer saccharum]